MLNNFHLVKLIIKRNLFFSIVFIIEVILCLFIVTLSFNRYNEQTRLLQTFNRPELIKSIAFFYQPNPYQDDHAFDEQNGVKFVESKLKNNDCFIKAESVQRSTLENESLSLSIINYGQMTSELFKLPLKSGNYPQNTANNDFIEVIQLENRNSNNTAKIGEIIEIQTVSEAFKKINDPSNYLKLKVVGTVQKEDVLVLSTGHTLYEGNLISLDEILAKNIALTNSFLTNIDIDLDPSSHFIMIYLDSNTPVNTVFEINEQLRQYGSSYTIQELIDGTDNILRIRFNKDLPILIMVIFILLTGMVSLASLNTIKNQNTLSIFNKLGASKTECLLLFFLSFFILINTSMILFRILLFIAYLTDSRKGILYFRVTSELNFWLWVAVFVISILSFIPMLLTLKTKTK